MHGPASSAVEETTRGCRDLGACECAGLCATSADQWHASAGSKGSVRIKEAAVVQLPAAMSRARDSLIRASQTLNPQNFKRTSLVRLRCP